MNESGRPPTQGNRHTPTPSTSSIPAAWHELAEYEVACAYASGVAEGRRAFAAEMLSALGMAYPGSSIREGIANHFRAVDQLQRRREADAAASLPRPGDRRGMVA